MSVGAEMASGRPGVIISNDNDCVKSPVVTVVYTTTQPQAHSGSPCILYSGEKRWAHCNQPMTVDKSRLKKYETTLSEQEMCKVDRALVFTLGLNGAISAQERELREKQTEQEKEMIRLQADRDIHKKLYVAVLEKLVAVQLERDLAVNAAKSVAEEPVVPVEEESVSPDVLLNPNTCTFDEMRANGVTPNLCLQIIAHRPYKEMSELAGLPGVNDWVYARLCEGMCIPAAEQPVVEEPVIEEPEQEPELVDLNKCGLGDLTGLGFSLATAKMIQAARPYDCVEDLSGVPGVTRIAYQIVRNRVTVGEPSKPEPVAEVPVVSLEKPEPKKPKKKQKTTTEEKPESTKMVNVNLCTARDLQKVCGLGRGTAENIVSHRIVNGRFTCMADVGGVRGMGKANMKKIEGHLEF